MNKAYSRTPAVLLLVWAMGAHAQEGGTCEPGASAPAPDPAFGTDGLALLGFDIDTPGSFAAKHDDFASAIAVQPDGKLLVGGHATTGPDDFGRDAALVRLLPDGQLDPGFGEGGRVLLGIRPSPGSAGISDIAVQADGRIVLFGTLCAGNNSCSNQNLFFARLNADGTFDTGFDFNGTRVLDPSGFSENASGLIIQPDGKLLGTGVSRRVVDKEPQACALLVRLNPDGSGDAGFGDEDFGADGQTCLLSDNDSELPLAAGADLALLADGRILVAGAATHSGTTPPVNADMAVFRLLADGQLDTSFGDQGWSFVAFDQGGSFTDIAEALVLDTMGRIVLAGSAEGTQSSDMAVARLLPDGTLDGSFGTGGRVLLAFDDDGRGSGATGVAVLDDGRILLGGNSHRLTTETFPDWEPAGAAALLRADGSPDPCFGDDGRWVQALPEDDRGNFAALAQGAGRVYLAGSADVPDPSSSTGSSRDFMITAFGGIPLPDAIFDDRFEQ